MKFAKHFLSLCSFILFFFLILGKENLFAQETKKDKIILNNGSVIYGIITEEKENEFVVVQLSSETSLVIPFEEIKSIGENIGIGDIKKPKPSLPILYRDKGIYGTYAGGFGFGNAFRDIFFMIETDATFGYRWSRFAATGLGIGSHLYPSAGNCNPLYAEFRGNITNKRMSPMYYLKAGYAIRSVTTGLSQDFKAGTFLSVGIGYREYTARKFGWMYSVGYQFQHTNQKWQQNIPVVNPNTGEISFLLVDINAIVRFNRVVWTWGILF